MNLNTFQNIVTNTLNSDIEHVYKLYKNKNNLTTFNDNNNYYIHYSLLNRGEPLEQMGGAV